MKKETLKSDIKQIINNYVTDGFVKKDIIFEEINECIDELELKDTKCKHTEFLKSIHEDLIEGDTRGFNQDMIDKHLFVYLHKGKDYCNCNE
jgi:hypothetical protein